MKQLLTTIEYDYPLRAGIINASRNLGENQAVYIRQFPTLMGVETIQLRVKDRPPHGWFGLAKVIRITDSEIQNEIEMSLIIQKKRGRHRCDSDSMIYERR